MFFSLKVMVFKSNDNKINYNAVTIMPVPMQLAKNAIEKPGDKIIFPNPLFYGDRILRNYVWNSQYPQDRDDRVKSTPLRNLAILYSNTPFHDNATANNTIYPVIVTDPSNFVDKNQVANVFGWCQLPGVNVSLTMASFEVSTCESDAIL